MAIVSICLVLYPVVDKEISGEAINVHQRMVLAISILISQKILYSDGDGAGDGDGDGDGDGWNEADHDMGRWWLA